MMSEAPSFEDLPFNSRPDLTPYLVHLTKNSNAADEYSGYENLVSILRTGEIWGSDRKSGFIKGSRKATCFMYVPFSSLKYVLTPENTDPENPRYEPYGVVVTKRLGYERGCRPVMYLSDEELSRLNVPSDDLWRVVKFEVKEERWISWLHEREWRCPDTFKLPKALQAVLVKSTKEAKQLRDDIAVNAKEYKCIPRSIIPLKVICQGLLS